MTVDRNVRCQQNFAGRTIRVLVPATENNLAGTPLPLVPRALSTLAVMQPGEVKTITLPDESEDASS